MKFNAKVNNDKTIIATLASETDKHLSFELKDKEVFFFFDKTKVFDSALFTRKLSTLFKTIRGKSFNLNLNSFIETLSIDTEKIINIILTKAQNLLEQSLDLRTKKENFEINIIYDKKYEAIVKKTKNICLAIKEGKYLQLLPHNICSVKYFVDYVKKLFENSKNVKVRVLDKKQLKTLKMNLFLSVNQASNKDDEASLIILEYKDVSKKPTTLVGKGLVFDSGGYSLKPPAYLKDMNQDKAGACSVLSTIYALDKNNINVNVLGLLPLSPNMINESAMIIHDVYKSMDGTTVEITNTDAEGRLLLADSITYAFQKYKSSSILTIATLTGTSELVFGDIHNPYWANDEKTRKIIEQSAIDSGEYVWNLPLNYEYELMNKESTTADLLNSAHERFCGNGTAAAFLKHFDKSNDFVHFDVAGTHLFKKTTISVLVLMLYYYVIGKNNAR